MSEKEFVNKAIELFCRRVKAAKQAGQIDNSKLVAGSPMAFYCRDCGTLSDMVEEEYLFDPYTQCSQCQGLQDAGLLKLAKEKANEEQI